jgi:hypothetical protein
MDTNGREFEGDLFVSIGVYSWLQPVWAGWNNREWTLMDANLRRTIRVDSRLFVVATSLGRLE